MTDDILLAKLATVDRCLHRIRKVSGDNPDAVENIDTQDIVVLNLQRAIQAAIDLAAWYLSSQHLGLPDTLKSHFTILRSAGIIDSELCQHLEAMVGFRNIAVHQYQQLDLDILKHIISHRLGDLEGFAMVIKTKLKSQ
ncbi:MAG: DUF86 domain-containing protein [Gammaproteobacteria bacterium]